MSLTYDFQSKDYSEYRRHRCILAHMTQPMLLMLMGE
ncbi:MAG: hypothetical protein ACJA0T_002573, partial [Colwellia sp.]